MPTTPRPTPRPTRRQQHPSEPPPIEGTGGALNPYALVELLGNKRQIRALGRDPMAVFEEFFAMPAKRLFGGRDDSPLYMHRVLGEPEHRAVEQGTDALTRRCKTLHALHDLTPRVRDYLIRYVLYPPYIDSPFLRIDAGSFFDEAPEYSDPVQGGLADCWLLAAMSSVAFTRPDVIVNQQRPTGERQDRFVNVTHFHLPVVDVEIAETEKYPSNNNGWVYARSPETGEIWPNVIEKAWARMATGAGTLDYSKLNGGDCIAATRILTGEHSVSWKITKDATVGEIEGLIRGQSPRATTVNPMVAWTYGKESDAPDKFSYATTGIAAWHCYSVLGIVDAGHNAYVVLRNPWGAGVATVDTVGGTFAAETATYQPNIPLGTNGVFALKLASFKKYYAGIAAIHR